MFYFNQISKIGILVNLFIIPLIGFVVVPMGLTSVFLYSVYEPVASLCIKGSSYVIEKSISIVTFFSDMSFAAEKTFTPTLLEIIFFYLVIFTVLNIKKKRIVKYSVISLVLFLMFDTAYWTHERFFHDDLRVTVLDVGQGSSALLEIPGGQTVLIDGGGFSDNTYFDIGERVVGPFLWRKKIMTVDTLILSHPNSDHLNGLIYIAKHFKVKHLWTNGETAKTFGYKNLMEVIKEHKIDMPAFETVSRKKTLNGVSLEILYPERNFLSKLKSDRWRNRNNNSIVVKAAFGKTSIVFPGDIMARAEIELIALKRDELKSTVLISPHHGSKTSSTDLFLDAVKPEYIVISSGWRNRFGFPHPRILEKYHAHGYTILRTDISGAITMITDGENIKLETEVQNDNN
jgi:competence protein ComEC